VGQGCVGVSVDWVTGRDPPNPALELFQIWFQSSTTERGLNSFPNGCIAEMVTTVLVCFHD
jgi:hypothetical protein